MSVAKDIGKFFIRPDVQNILKKLTGFQTNKIFASQFNVKLKSPKIELLSEEELQRYTARAERKAHYLLQMPPVLSPREPCDKVIVEDPKLNLLNTTNTKYIFIDISMNIPQRNRKIVVREPNGTLRHASWKEREKTLQIYYPTEGRLPETPKMFNPDILEDRLKEKKYLYLLNQTCLEFEPDDPEFIRVSNRTYEVVDKTQEYEALKSTRFYGPMVFYLTWFKKLDNILSHYINNSNINDALDIAKLFYKLHPEAKTSSLIKSDDDPLNQLQILITQELVENVKSELAFKKYIESTKAIKNQASN